MGTLRRLRRALLATKDVEVYLSIGLALSVGVLGLVDVVGNDTVAAATLATLAVIAVSLLVSRHQMAQLEQGVRGLTATVRDQSLAGVSLDRLLSASTAGAGLPIAGAQDIRISGVTLNRTIRNNYDELERLLRDGASIRIALIDPDGSAPEEAARRCSVPDEPQIFEHRLNPTLGLLRRLSATSPRRGRVEVRLLPFVPAVGLILIDVEQAAGRVFVDVYAHRPIGPEPVLSLERDRDPRWYRHFAQEFDRIWAAGRVPGPADGFAADPA